MIHSVNNSIHFKTQKRSIIRVLILVLFVVPFTSKAQYLVTTLAGSTIGSTNGSGSDAQFNKPSGVAVDPQGNVYVADYRNNRIRKITPIGEVTTFAGLFQGNTDGTATDAAFFNPYGLVIDPFGNLYVADTWNHCIRKITSQGVVSTIAGSSDGYLDATGTNARFSYPRSLALDAQGNVYVADQGNHKIRKITPQGSVTTFAGSSQGFANGLGSTAKFDTPYGIAIDAQGNVYVADQGNHKIRKITPQGAVSTYAGSTLGFANGGVTTAQFNEPTGIAVDAQGNVYVADQSNHKIRKISSALFVSTIAGTTNGFSEGAGNVAQFSYPTAVAIDTQGNIYVADYANEKIRKIEYFEGVGIETLNAIELEMFPNPTTEEITLRFTESSSINLIIRDAQGNHLQTVDQVESGSVISLKSYTSGIYFIEIVSPTFSCIQRIIKQ